MTQQRPIPGKLYKVINADYAKTVRVRTGTNFTNLVDFYMDIPVNSIVLCLRSAAAKECMAPSRCSVVLCDDKICLLADGSLDEIDIS